MGDTDEKPRTEKQRTSLFGTLTEYAEKLDASGYEYTVFIEHAKKRALKLNGQNTIYMSYSMLYLKQ